MADDIDIQNRIDNVLAEKREKERRWNELMKQTQSKKADTGRCSSCGSTDRELIEGHYVNGNESSLGDFVPDILRCNECLNEDYW